MIMSSEPANTTVAAAAEPVDWSIDDIVHWMVTEGRLVVDPPRFVQGLGGRLVEAGAPLSRLRVAPRIMDPLVRAWGLVWIRDGDRVDQFQVGHGVEMTEAYLGSPFQHVIETGTPYRRRLDSVDAATDHLAIREVAAAGATDYLACPLVYADGTVQATSYATDRPGGFTDADIDKLVLLTHHLAPVSEVMAVRITMRRLLETYLGRGTAGQVLAGSVRRGDVQDIDAAVMYADLRDFTGKSEKWNAGTVLGALNAFLETVVAAVAGADGEVLKFVGDSVLAIFPAPPDGDPSMACRAALDAAATAHASMGRLNGARAAAGAEPLGYGITLDLGRVTYGNIGGPDRLDFTVIGPVVNMVSRLQEVCKQLGEPIVSSRRLADGAGIEGRALGVFPIRGFEAPVAVVAPPPL